MRKVRKCGTGVPPVGPRARCACYLRDPHRNDRICPHRTMRTGAHSIAGLIRVTLATILLLGLLGGMFPLETLASAPTCALACCAARAPHAAGSCLNGSCHAVSGKRKQLRARLREPLCSSTLIARDVARKRYPTIIGAEKTTTASAEVYSSTISKPCSPDCGSCPSSFENSGSQRSVALTAPTPLPKPPSGIQQLNARSALNQTLHALCRQCAPRAPPISLS